MRLPLSKVWRAFPELDRFSDEDCRRFVRLASERHTSGAVATAFAGIAIGVLGVFVVTPAASAVVTEIVRGLRLNEGVYLGIIGLTMLVVAPLGPVLGLMLRDFWLRRTIGKRLIGARCPGCDYSILGLPVEDGHVRCPECGLAVSLAERGLTPEAIMSHRSP